jgi:DNA-binding CsgD family transcriptional regulator
MNLLPRHLQQLFKKKKGGRKRRFALVASALNLVRPSNQPQAEPLAALEKAEQDPTDQPNYSPDFEIFPADPAIRKPWFSLTIREREVAALLCMGYRNYDVAAMLGVEYSTIQTHLQNIFYKFELRSGKEIRQALTSWAAEEWWKAHHG